MFKKRGWQKDKWKCKYCGGNDHTSLMCLRKPRHAMRQESKNHKLNRMRTSDSWYTINPPDKDGHWQCYLQISPYCLKVLDRSTISLEHIYPKIKWPELRYRHENIMPSCAYCNKLKLSNTLNQLCKFSQVVCDLVSTLEWQEREDRLQELSEELGSRHLDRPLPGQIAQAQFPKTSSSSE